MPFGSIYGALFLFVLGIWAIFADTGGEWGALQPARLFLALLAIAVAVGLLARRPWARWAGALMGAGLVLLVLFVVTLDAGVAAYLMLFGSFAAALLLALPATGAPPASAAPKPPNRSVVPRIAAATAMLGAVGVLATAGWSVAVPSRPAATAEQRPASPAGLDRRVAWTDFGTGLDRARGEGKPVFVSFETGWCGYCKKMNKTTWKHPEVIERLGRIVAVRVDAEETTERNGFRGDRLAARYGVNGFPTMILLDADGQVIDRTGGYQEPRQLLAWLEQSLGRRGHARSTGLGTSLR